MRMAILGICGRMGQKIYEYYKDIYTIIGVDVFNHSSIQTYHHIKEIPQKVDVIVDFSSPSAEEELRWALQQGILVLSGTTGYEEEILKELKELGKDKFYWSANYSKGIELFTRLIQQVYKEYALFDFIEIHASTKKDIPSGTAKMLARKLGIGDEKIQSLRIEYAPPIHELIFSSKNEQIVLRHEVINSMAFLEGFDEKLHKMLGM